MKINLLLVLIFFLSITGYSQVAINEDASDPDSSAMLDIKSTHKGLLIPRMNFSQMYNVDRPATGLLVFNTSANVFYYYDGGNWRNLSNPLHDKSFKSLNINETLNLRASKTPKAPKLGDLYMDIKTKKLRCWNGTEWKNLW